MLLLFRAHASAGTQHPDSSEAGRTVTSSSGGGSLHGYGWQAGWVGGREVAGWGIRVTKHAAFDHYASRLLDVLSNLADAEPCMP